VIYDTLNFSKRKTQANPKNRVRAEAIAHKLSISI
jgi:hypothetical protein